jgi:hypothetical protein
MKPHPRIRKTIKWGGAVVTLLLVVVWIGSGWWYVTWNEREKFAAVLTEGRVCVGHWLGIPTASWPRVYYVRRWRGEFHLELGFARANDSILGTWALPLWLPATLAALPTCAAWCIDLRNGRRKRLGHCVSCNYDRAGIAREAKCPECGSGGGAAP